MPEATPAGILKVNVRQAAANPLKVVACDTSGVAYPQSQVLARLQGASDRSNA